MIIKLRLKYHCRVVKKHTQLCQNKNWKHRVLNSSKHPETKNTQPKHTTKLLTLSQSITI